MTDINIDAFLVGVSKSASTWLYHCFKEHPQINVPSSDSLRFFDLKYHKGFDWYKEFYQSTEQGGVTIDPSPTYFRSPVAIRRINQHFPEAKFILSLRNPVERAFSQFWHEKKEGHFDYEFNECLHRFILYSHIIEHGFYATHLEALYEYVSPSQVKIVFFDDLKIDSEKFYSSICEFLNVDSLHRPDVLTKRINAAGVKANKGVKLVRSVSNNPIVLPIKRIIKKTFKLEGVVRGISAQVSNTSEYDKGIGDDARSELLEVYMPEIERLEKMTGIDLAHWKC